MDSISPGIEFFEGIFEELTDIRFMRHRVSGLHSAKLIFKKLRSIEQFNSYRRRFTQALRLTDEEGVIELQPASIQFIFGGDDGDDLLRVECKVEIEQEDHWERLMRFMHRYAEANGMEYGEPVEP
jgi:photosystem II Psb28-2 protein